MRHRRDRGYTYQGELFETPSDQPNWLELPGTTREAVKSLLAQILAEQRQQRQAGLEMEREHE
jgi:hypothetical protein